MAVADLVGQVEEKQLMLPSERYHLRRCLEKAMEAAMVPSSRVCVLQHVMHDLLGCMADDVADHVDEAVEIATELIEKVRKIPQGCEFGFVRA